MLFLHLIINFCCSSIVESTFKDLSGHWEGRFIHSPSASDPYIFDFNVSADFEYLKGSEHLTLTVTNHTNKNTMLFFIKEYPEIKNRVIVSDRFDEDFAELSIIEGYEKHIYLIRGIIKPKNDQVTISLESTTLSLSITDQFSSNVTLINLSQEFKNAKINYYVRIGLIFSVMVAIFCGLYKMSDLTDVIPEEEGKTALAIKQMSLAQERAKKLNEEKKKSPQSSKPKTD
ncbi:hypothetical protein M9Y10_042210 [Tritrichomonas musculus]|uniref:Uncharacterized protein n=1 Tax=Tritrichomonas musculus TaxID=1915356 RepID=A0ABR2K8C1_9EUKA